MSDVHIGLASSAALNDALLDAIAEVASVRPVLRDDLGLPAAGCRVEVGEGDVTDLTKQVRRIAASFDATGAVATGPLASSAPGLLISDVDSTMITSEVIDMLAEHAGRRDEVAAVTERAMRGELDFAQSLAARVEALAGLPLRVIEEVAEAVELSPGAADLVAHVERGGGRVALVSGGFIEVVERIAARLGIDLIAANRLETAGGVLTGRTIGPIIDRTAKAHWLGEFARTIEAASVVAIGDGANDLDMLARADLGIAYCAKPVTARSADAAIDFPRLDAAAAFWPKPA